MVWWSTTTYSFIIVHMRNPLLHNFGTWLTGNPRIWKEKKEDIKINSSFYILAQNNALLSVSYFMVGSIKSISKQPFNALLKQMLIKEITELQDVCLWMGVKLTHQLTLKHLNHLGIVSCSSKNTFATQFGGKKFVWAHGQIDSQLISCHCCWMAWKYIWI